MPHRPSLCLVPFDVVNQKILRHLAAAITEHFSLPVRVLDSQPLPPHTYHLTRNQHHSTGLLEHLLEQHPEAFRILGIAAVDLYIPIFTFVFGEAQLEGRAAVISLFRPGGGEDRVRPPSPVLLERLVKLSLHELGHTFGIGHCRQPGCLMGFSATLEKLDQKTLTFCQYCRILLNDFFKGLQNL